MGEVNNLEPDRRGSDARKLSILIVDEHPIVRFGIMRRLRDEPDLHVIADIPSCKTAGGILRNEMPDLLLMDMHMQGGCAQTLITKIGELGLDTRVLIYSAQTEGSQILDALRQGAHGYITKNAEPDRLCEAIHVVAGGDAYVDPSIASRVIGRLGRTNERRTSHSRQLTRRETAVLKGLATGKRSREIAGELYISESTVKYHLSSIFNKLRVHNRTEAARFAFEHGLIE